MNKYKQANRNFENWLKGRAQVEQDTISWLNDNDFQGWPGSKVYDFGNLGLLQVWWARFGWETRWLEVEKPPEEIKPE